MTTKRWEEELYSLCLLLYSLTNHHWILHVHTAYLNRNAVCSTLSSVQYVRTTSLLQLTWRERTKELTEMWALMSTSMTDGAHTVLWHWERIWLPCQPVPRNPAEPQQTSPTPPRRERWLERLETERHMVTLISVLKGFKRPINLAAIFTSHWSMIIWRVGLFCLIDYICLKCSGGEV